MVQSLAVVLVDELVAFLTGAEITSLQIMALLRANSRRRAFVQILADFCVGRIKDFALRASTQSSNGGLDTVV